MKKRPSSSQVNPAAGREHARRGLIHPVIIYPFHPPNDYSDLEELYRMAANLNEDNETFARPITVIDRKTHHAVEGSKAYLSFRKSVIAAHSDILDEWCVDTCQMWYSGLGMASERGAPGDVYWLVPGDFNYGSPGGKDVLGRLHELPEIVLDLQQDFCVGEIATEHIHSKQLIDTYGTFALLYNWFPAEAQGIRKVTERPRSEFFAISHEFLSEMLRERWYAYEQTMVILLKSVFRNKSISKFFVGGISDLPGGRESLTSAVQQVERTERVLKTLWLDWNHDRVQPSPVGRERVPDRAGEGPTNSGWAEQYCVLERQSDQVRRSALLTLRTLLG